MLILTRRVGERIVIDNEISVTVLRIRGNEIRVGLQAPSNVLIRRDEISHRSEALTLKGPDCTARVSAPEIKIQQKRQSNPLARPASTRISVYTYGVAGGDE